MVKETDNASFKQETVYDVAIIGGGITGAGIYLEALKNGYNCILIEKGDFASGTSSKSAKLIHGGLRYLQYGHFALVRRSLKEREYLLSEYPELVKPLEFVIPVYDSMIKMWLGMTLYDKLNPFHSLPGFKKLNKSQLVDMFPNINRDGLKGGYKYYDAVTNDAKLVMHLIQKGVDEWAGIALNHTRVFSLEENPDYVSLVCEETETTQHIKINARAVVNATGPWMDETLMSFKQEKQHVLNPSCGVHLVLPQSRFSIKSAWVFSSGSNDGASFYALPWENDTVIVGVTDTEFHGNLDDVGHTKQDIKYLLNGINQFAPGLDIKEPDILRVFSGLRPLLASGRSSKERNRGYRVWWSSNRTLSVAGGKLTSFHSMAQTAMVEMDNKSVELGLLISNQPDRMIHN